MKYTEEMILQSDSGYCMPFEEQQGKDVELSLGYGEQTDPVTGEKFFHHGIDFNVRCCLLYTSSCSMEIAKQLYDVGRLFENVSDLQITKEAFRKIAVVELSYRSFGTDIGQVFNDIRQTALCISTRGKAGEGDFDLIQDGIIRVKSFMYKQRYLIDHAIIDAARAAYLATLIEKGINEIESYSNNPADIKDMVIRPSLPNKLNKLRSNLPEAYYYWAKTSELLEA